MDINLQLDLKFANQGVDWAKMRVSCTYYGNRAYGKYIEMMYKKNCFIQTMD